MRVQVMGSIAAHVAVGAVLMLVRRDGVPVSSGESSPALEIIEVPPAPTPPPAPTSAIGASGGGNTAPVRIAATTPRRSARSRAVADVDPRGAITFESSRGAGESGGDGGEGGGIGGGRGDGIGLGIGGALAPPAPPPPPPPPPRGEPPVSKARPAKLIYPKRARDTVEGETFIARVTIDAEGYVVGARLVRGFGGPRDDDAAGLIFKFRYAPALDDEGHPIRSTLDQNFLVE